MNIHAKMPNTVEDFFAWNEGREGKREFVRGKVVEMMIHTTRFHTRLCTNLLFELGNSFDNRKFDYGSADFGVKTQDGIRFPDVIVDKVTPETQGSDLTARCPILLVEVLSPSSYVRDFGEKVEDYKSLPTLAHYLILAQDEARAWLWSKRHEGWDGPELFADVKSSVPLTGLGISLSMTALYHHIVDPS